MSLRLIHMQVYLHGTLERLISISIDINFPEPLSDNGLLELVDTTYLDYWGNTSEPSEVIYIPRVFAYDRYSIKLDPVLVGANQDFKISVALLQMRCRTSESNTTYLKINVRAQRGREFTDIGFA